MLCGVGWRTSLVLPRDLLQRLGPPARDSVILHELAHFYRGDHWIRLMEMVCVALFWWNPVVWWTRRQIRFNEEQCCDSFVVAHIGNEERTYANALVDTIEFLSTTRPVIPPVASGMGDMKFMKRRMTSIMTRSVAPSLNRAGKLAVGVFALLLLPFVPTWGQPPESESADKQTEEQVTASPTPKSPINPDREKEPSDKPAGVADQLWQLNYLIAQEKSKTQDGKIEDRIKLYQQAFVAQTKFSALVKDGITISMRRDSNGDRVAWLRFEQAKQLKAGVKKLQKLLSRCRVARSVKINVGFMRDEKGAKRNDARYYFINDESFRIEKSEEQIRSKIKDLRAAIDSA